MIISKLYAFHSRSTNLILTGLLEQQTIFGMTPVVRGDTLNGIVEATAREKIVEFKKKEKRLKTIVISANPN